MRGSGRVFLRAMARPVVLGVLVVGCGSQQPAPQTTAARSSIPTLLPSPVTTSPPSTVATTTSFRGVGDPAAIAAAREEALALIEMDPASFPPGAAEMEIPWPDTTNPDPVAALRSIWEFDEWVATTLPYDAFARMYLVEDSPAWSQAGEFITQLDLDQWIVVFDDPVGFEWIGGETVDGSGLLPIEPKAGSVVVRYRSRQSDASIRRLDGSIVIEGSGYQEQERFAVLVPTDLGWKIQWYGQVT